MKSSSQIETSLSKEMRHRRNNFELQAQTSAQTQEQAEQAQEDLVAEASTLNG